MKEAFYLARSGRPGPVLIDLPKTCRHRVASSPIRARSISLRTSRAARTPLASPSRRRAHGKTDKAILYVGGGVVASNGAGELLALAEKLNLPVTPTLMGLGCSLRERPCVSACGNARTYAANMAMAKADLVVAIGARFDDRVTGKLEEFAKHATIVHVDIDPASVNKNVKVDVPIVGDAKSVLEQMLEVLPDDANARARGLVEHAARVATRLSTFVSPMRRRDHAASAYVHARRRHAR